uniref:RNase H type-1 domain-containing protein n=1 Tax=viral metagenome TaxID=1070528 RepID=A0A6C0ESY5_9ZZZZ
MSRLVLPKIKNTFIKYSEIKIYPEISSGFRLQFDGCSKGNPGISGAGAVIYNFDEEIWWDSLFVGENTTNNYAEYSGLILGLKKAIELDIKEIIVEGDSTLVIKQMKGDYKVYSENLQDLHREALKLCENFDSIQFTHIYRINNKRADYLSNLAIQGYYK